MWYEYCEGKVVTESPEYKPGKGMGLDWLALCRKAGKCGKRTMLSLLNDECPFPNF